MEIIKLFGDNIVNIDGSLNRKALAEIIYEDFESKEKLDKLTFNFVCKEIKDQIQLLNTKTKYALIDAPLLFESNLDEICDIIIAVIADKKEKITRICLRDKVSEEIANKRLNIQQEDSYYISKSDYVIENNNEYKTKEKVKEICDKIKY